VRVAAVTKGLSAVGALTGAAAAADVDCAKTYADVASHAATTKPDPIRRERAERRMNFMGVLRGDAKSRTTVRRGGATLTLHLCDEESAAAPR
jgi:hypothetical protein